MVIQVIQLEIYHYNDWPFPPPMCPLVPPKVSAVLPSGSAPDLRRSRLEKLLTKQDRKNYTFTFSEGTSVDLSGCGSVFFGIKYYVCVLYTILYIRIPYNY